MGTKQARRVKVQNGEGRQRTVEIAPEANPGGGADVLKTLRY